MHKIVKEAVALTPSDNSSKEKIEKISSRSKQLCRQLELFARMKDQTINYLNARVNKC